MKYFTKTAFLVRKSQHFLDHMGGRSRDMGKAVETFVTKLERSGKGPVGERATELPGVRSQFKAIRASTIRAENQYHTNIKDGMGWEDARKKLDNLTGMEFKQGKDRFVVSMRRPLSELRRGGAHTTDRGFTLVSPQPPGFQSTYKKAKNINTKIDKYDAVVKRIKPQAYISDSEQKSLMAQIHAKYG